KTIVVALSTTDSAQPAGTAAQGGIMFTLSNGAAPQLVAVAPFSATFADVAPGSYTVTAQAVDVAGAAVGPAVISEAFTVADDSVAYLLPAGLTVTVQ
ncbi:MAG: hypothetical protein PW947_17905, partial [Paraburkholderia sp.]|nr:hypothetical protein [Paraburkholderia sp.]